MRVLFTTQAATGHLHPLIPLGIALVEAGHSVLFACPPSAHKTLASVGLRAVAAGLEADHPLVLEARRGLGDLHYSQRPVVNHLRAWIATFGPAMLTDLRSVVESWSPDLVVRDSAEYAGLMLAELLRVPHASVRTTPLSSSWTRRHLLGPALDQLRVSSGLTRDPDVQAPFRHLQLVFAPPNFRPPGEAPAPTTHVLRPTVFDRSGEDSLPQWVHELPRRPTVYATLGTVVDEPELLIAIMQALSLEDVNVIVTVGRGRDPDRLLTPPANAHVCSYIPQSLLLPHCEVVVAHGGYNTIVGCIDAGVPMLLLPVRGDQAEDAAWCAQAGIARVLTPGQQSPLRIRQAVCDLLENPACRRRAAAVRQSMHQQPGVERALQLLESLPSQRVP